MIHDSKVIWNTMFINEESKRVAGKSRNQLYGTEYSQAAFNYWGASFDSSHDLGRNG
jgi:hypothetical protein